MGKYINRGTLIVYFVPTLVSQSSPSIAAITAGTNLTGAVAEIKGFEYKASQVKVPTMDTIFDLTIPGTLAVTDSSLTIYDDDTATTIRTAMSTLNTNGFIVLAPYGLSSSKRCEVWPVRTASYSDTKTMANEAAKSVIEFGITGTPTLNATLAT